MVVQGQSVKYVHLKNIVLYGIPIFSHLSYYISVVYTYSDYDIIIMEASVMPTIDLIGPAIWYQ